MIDQNRDNINPTQGNKLGTDHGENELSTLEQFPDELLLKIFSFCTAEDIKNSRLTNKRFARVLTEFIPYALKLESQSLYF